MQGPRLYRFFNYELPVYLPAPTGGWSPDVNPWELPITEAPQLDNFLIRPGKIVMRGPLVVSADLSTWYPVNLAGAAMTNTGQLLGRKSTSGGQVDPWNAPLLTPQASSLASGLTSALWIVGSAASPITVTADQIPGPRSINFYGEIYGISYDSAGSVVQDANSTYHMKPLSLYNLTKSSPTSATGTATTFANNGGSGTTAWNTTPPPSVTVPSGGPSSAAQLLLCEGLGFALPSTATIQGIQLTVNFSISGSGGAGQSEAFNAFMVKGGVVQSVTRNAAPYTYPSGSSSWSFSVGGSTDLWGGTWAYTDINAANFGVEISNLADTAGTWTVTSVTLQVWYTISAPTINVLSNAPHGAFDLIGYQSRLWLLGGIDTPGAGTTHDPHALFFTNPIAAGGGSATADWQDPVTGLTNKIVMDGDTSDYGVGLATVRNGLVILRRASVYLLKGSTTANYTLIPISREVGCVDARSIVETDRGVYFMSLEGLMFTNGVSVANVSGTLTYTLQQAIEAEQNAILTGSSGYVTCQRTSRGQILVSVGVSGIGAAGSYTPILTAMLDPQVSKGGAWVRITSQLWSNDGTQLTGNNYAGQIYDYATPKRLVAIGDRYVTTFEDQTARSTFLDPNSGLYDQLPSGASPFLSIPAVWRTPIPAITTANKRVIAIARRYYIDYNFAGSNLPSTNGWHLVPIDVDSAEIDTPQITPLGTLTRAGFGSTPATTAWVSGTTPNSTATMLRMNRDWCPEIRDCTFVVWWSDVAQAAQPAQTIAEIYGLGLEFQRARDLRNVP